MSDVFSIPRTHFIERNTVLPKNMTTVSVVVPTYNRANVLPRAIESVRSQTFNDLELIIVDDGSTDNTAEVIENTDESWIRFHQFDNNRGANAARNKGIELAEGNYISFLDSDDELHPKHIEVVLDVFDQYDSKQVLGVYTARENHRGGEPVKVSSPGNRLITQSDVVSGDIAGGFTCATFDATVFDNIGFLDEELPALQDLDLFIRILNNYQIAGVSDVLATCHLGDGRISSDVTRKLAAQEHILEKHGEALTDAGIARLYYYTAFGFAQDGDFNSARSYFKRAIQITPTKWLAYVHYLASFHPILFNALLNSKEYLQKILRKLK